jgi:hypothetical protein
MESTRVLCPACAGSDLEDLAGPGLGVVRRAATAVHATEQWLHRVRRPCTVLLDEGFALAATLCAEQYAAVAVGARVQVTMVDGDAGMPQFRLL